MKRWAAKGLQKMLLCIFAGLAMPGAHAQMHPSEPAVNLGDTSFLDGIGGPGFLIEEIADGQHSNRVFGETGNAIPSSTGSNAISGITHVAWLSSRRILAGWYGVELVQAAAHVNAGPEKLATGAGDLTLSPLILQWRDQRLGPLRLSQRVVLDFDLPTGEYQQNAPLSLSSHAFDVHPYYAITMRPSRRLETSWRIHYLWNATNKAPSNASEASSTQAGQAIHFNATLGYRLAGGLWAGANGYYLSQITSPKINGEPLEHSPEQVGAIGPGVVWDLGKWMLYANAYHEIGAVNRPEGNKIVLRMQWLPGRKRRE
jgi:hypothetical protein